MALGFIWLLCLTSAAAVDPSRRFVYPDADGKLVYDTDTDGNRIVDFSYAGYASGNRTLPIVKPKVLVEPIAGDNTARIQAAIDYVSTLPMDSDGLRGAVQLSRGSFPLLGRLRIESSGVILRGTGSDQNGTKLLAAGHDRTNVIRICGRNDRHTLGLLKTRQAKIPCGSKSIELESFEPIEVGDQVVITRHSTKAWIAAIGNRFPTDEKGSWLDWRPDTMDVEWHREIESITDNAINLDAPLTESLDGVLAQWSISRFRWPGRIEQVGVENLAIESEFDHANPQDENHAWGGIAIENARDCWVQGVTFRGLAGSAVAVWETGSRVTVSDCQSSAPVSENAGYRRHTFYTSGGQTLFIRCSSIDGRHDFAVGHLASGPTVFSFCRADRASEFSGPIESWASGVLYDNVTLDGGGLALTNRETQQQGIGWSATNCVLWQCTAPTITCRQPPLGDNWSIGCWGEFIGDGHWRSMNEFVTPHSLFEAQGRERGVDVAVHKIVRDALAPDCPSIETVLAAAGHPTTQSVSPPVQTRTIERRNGWLVCDNQLLIGGRANTVWWRGSILPRRAGELGVGVTRFVPGREGYGFTDDLGALARDLSKRRIVLLEHHWGLWYDRRRDDHQMVRRIDGNVWPPFYEQPWARSGHGRAWDGLSKYDLTKFNPWYFARLKMLAAEFSRHGQLLWQQMYFQHNVLEAGAHWADFPWRSANCLQDVGFPEPPPYVNNKRIFMADQFYDITHPVRRELHRLYIQHCLSQLGDSRNVVFSIGEEFTGPESFVRFWLETIADWRQKHGQKILVSLGCTKDVQDTILEDPQLASQIDIIEQKYWWYTKDGGTFAPQGGVNQAPRQQLREYRGEKGISPISIVRQVSEYRLRYPDKAVVCSHPPKSSWWAAVAGASIVDLPSGTSPDLLKFFVNASPDQSTGPNSFVMASLVSRDGFEKLVLVAENVDPNKLSDLATNMSICQVDMRTGEVSAYDPGRTERDSLPNKFSAPALFWLRKSNL